MFFDEAKIYVKAGDGGNGVVAFRREAHVPRGGPSGGNGGRGADVYLVADPQVNTLIQFSHQVHFRAPNGEPGQGKNQTGAQGNDLVIRVPVGTVAYDDESGETLADLVRPGQRVRFLFTLGKPGVRAWDVSEPPDPRCVDVKRYQTLLKRAVETVLEPIRQSVYGGKDEECLYLFPPKHARPEISSGTSAPLPTGIPLQVRFALQTPPRHGRCVINA